MFVFRKNPPKKKKPRKPEPCCECGRPGVYGTDIFGVTSEQWRCRDCHERACQAHVRNENRLRYG